MEAMAFTEGKRYYTWFNKEFNDDTGEPYMYLQWILLFYYRKEYKLALQMLKKLIKQNIHMIPFVLGCPLERIEGFSYFSNWEMPEYIDSDEIAKMKYLDEDFKSWLNEQYMKHEIQALLEEDIALNKELKMTNDFERRSILIKKQNALFE